MAFCWRRIGRRLRYLVIPTLPNKDHHLSPCRPSTRSPCPLFPSAKVMLGRHVSSSSSAPLRSQATATTRSVRIKSISLRPQSSLVSPRIHQQLRPPCGVGIMSVASRNLSDLGLRTSQPPDSLPEPSPETPPELPDQEWEIRTGVLYALKHPASSSELTFEQGAQSLFCRRLFLNSSRPVLSRQ